MWLRGGCGGTPGERPGNEEARESRVAMTAAERKSRWRERRRCELQAPSLVARVSNPSIRVEQLTEFEQVVRSARLQVLDQLGGADRLAPTKLWQVDALISRWVVKEMLDLDVHRLARAGKLVNLDQKSRRSHPLLADWLKVMAGFEQALAAVGLTRAAPSIKSLEDITREANARAEAREPRPPTSPTVGFCGAQAPEAARSPSQPHGSQRGPERGADARVEPEPRHPVGQAEPLEVRPSSLMPDPERPTDSRA